MYDPNQSWYVLSQDDAHVHRTSERCVWRWRSEMKRKEGIIDCGCAQTSLLFYCPTSNLSIPPPPPSSSWWLPECTLVDWLVNTKDVSGYCASSALSFPHWQHSAGQTLCHSPAQSVKRWTQLPGWVWFVYFKVNELPDKLIYHAGGDENEAGMSHLLRVSTFGWTEQALMQEAAAAWNAHFS